MSLGDDEVKKIAHLARLAIEDSDIPVYAENLSNVLHLVEKMNDTDTDGISPMAHPIHAVQRLREDTVSEQNQRDVLQSNAPALEDGLFLVPRVIE